jgi:hypothetical protein
MGVPSGGGTNLGAAQGRIVIDTSGVRRAQSEVQSAAQGMTSALRTLGLGYSAMQLTRFVLENERIATSFRRQSVAAESLAGSQAQLNDLMATYERTTGGAVDRATALSDVTRLLAVGFADTTAELEEFVTAARGISVATGQQQDYVISQLQLAIANQSTLRLDQLGLGVSEVTNRIEELRAENSGLTKEMAYQQAILGLATQKYGALAKSQEAQATSVETLNKTLKDLRLELGEVFSPAVSAGADVLTNRIRTLRGDVQDFTKSLNELRAAQARAFGVSVPRGLVDTSGLESGGSFGKTRFTEAPRLGAGAHGVSTELSDLLRTRNDELAEIDKNAAEARLDTTRQYEEQRTSTIRQYEQTIAREAEDFARSRARAEQQLQRSILDIRADTIKREAEQTEELARQIADSRLESDERIADARADAAKRLTDIEENYQRNRERAERSHRERLLTAAGRLDAVAVREEQRRFAQEAKDAKEAHDDQRSDLQEQLQKRIADERENLDKRIKQANDAAQRQLEDARDADEERIKDMQADFAERIKIEDEDRAIRLERMAQDHNDQLGEMARQHSLRLQQIADHAREERQQNQEQFNIALNELGLQTDAWIKENQRVTNQIILDWTRVHGTVAQQAAALLNLVSQGGSHPSNADPYINRQLPMSSSGSIAPSGSRSVVVQPGAIQISVPPGMNQEWVGQIVYRELLEFFGGNP